ncbi:response regulator transcription factor [Allostreptomyces psammosilenae]|uniref:Sensory transduction protein RegX3 n=1 Tax=Allostreptomyces psammosilenae TaxID=1892865 RepID=A0A852ZXR7_9ACTN|nr:response regulator [Allostreptomyces psammosilenae]NYI03082.1 DNA-binding response OmpR family regulator [Allostreptomyces psammosilenae]
MQLLLVEDDDHVASALVTVLNRHHMAVRHVRNGEDALERLTQAGPDAFDAVLLDVGLPQQDGFRVCRRIRSHSATLPIIMVTARGDIRDRVHGLDLGADDYIVKPFDMTELIARILAVVRRTNRPPHQSRPAGAAGATEPGRAGSAAATAPGEPAATHPAPGAPEAHPATAGARRIGPIEIDADARRVRVRGSEVSLTRKEFDLLALLAERPGVVCRRQQILSEVWESSYDGLARSLEVHVASLRAKLALPDAIETVRGIGYRLTAGTSDEPAADPPTGPPGR